MEETNFDELKKDFEEFVKNSLNELLVRTEKLREILYIPKGYFSSYSKRKYIFTATEHRVYMLLKAIVKEYPNYVIFPKLRLDYLSFNDHEDNYDRKKHLYNTVDFVIADEKQAKSKLLVTFDEELIDIFDGDNKNAPRQKVWRRENQKVVKELLKNDNLIIIRSTDIDGNRELTEEFKNNIKKQLEV